jgi:hypothetical protein
MITYYSQWGPHRPQEWFKDQSGGAWNSHCLSKHREVTNERCSTSVIRMKRERDVGTSSDAPSRKDVVSLECHYVNQALLLLSLITKCATVGKTAPRCVTRNVRNHISLRGAR